MSNFAQKLDEYGNVDVVYRVDQKVKLKDQ